MIVGMMEPAFTNQSLAMNQNSPQSTLHNVFGFDTLRDGQQQVVEAILSGQSAAAIFPTGSGKSLCYQLPALHLPHLTLVVSPLIALMKDQLAFLHSKGISAAAIESGQTKQESQAIMNAVRNGELKILMISVERLKTNASDSLSRKCPFPCSWSTKRTVFQSGDIIFVQTI